MMNLRGFFILELYTGISIMEKISVYAFFRTNAFPDCLNVREIRMKEIPQVDARHVWMSIKSGKDSSV